MNKGYLIMLILTIVLIVIFAFIQYALLKHTKHLFTKCIPSLLLLLVFAFAVYDMNTCSGFLCEILGALLIFLVIGAGVGCFVGFLCWVMKNKKAPTD